MKFLLFILTTMLLNHSDASILTNQSMTIYSGNCILYKKTLEGGNKVRYTQIDQGFGKVVIGRTSKTFSFYFKDKLVHSRSQYLSSIDDRQGGESYSLDNGFSAFRYFAERTFNIFYLPGYGNPGVEYEIQNYKVN